ncbi:unnamed protein product [Leptosia nina]|uniref:Protein split ends n=1 Tax=Leptosia nina TaxID=320188 RepID=A0AAV1K2A0_9NEOP
MVRETRHLWVGNLPDNIREDRIREHFKRYGRVQNVKLLGRMEGASTGASGGSNSGVCATVAFMDIKSASKAHNIEHVLDERTLTTEYYEPAAIPTAAGAPSAGSSPAGSGYSGSSSSVNSTTPASTTRYHLSAEETANSTCAMAATAAAPAAWRGTNDSATSEFCRRGNTPATYGRYHQRNNAPYATPPSNTERTTPLHRWYVAGAGTGGESTPSTPGGVTDRRRRPSASGSSRSESTSPEPSDTSRASTPAAPPTAHHALPHHANHRTPSTHPHQWASTANGRPLAICVRNLPTRSTDSSLKDGLYHEYKKHGKVVWVKVVGQNADRYAVVRFKKPSDVEKALEVSQDKLFFGCKISVAPHQSCDDDAESAKPYETDIDEYHPKATRTLFIGNLEKDVTQQQLRDKFKHFGRIIEIDIKKGSGGGAGYAFCQYASISSVVEAIRAMDGEYVGSSRVKLGFGKPVATTCVWVDGLTEHTEKQVLAAVSRCGAATSVCVDRAAGAALVHFEQAAAAGAAVRELRRLAAHLSAAEPDQPRLCVDYASRECQDAFYEQLEKHGGSSTLTSSERLSTDLSGRYLPSARHEQIRYETGTSRSRAPSFGRSSSRTPRYNHDHYDPSDYAADRRVHEELGSSPPTDEAPYEDRLQSVVVSPHRTHKHRHDSSPEDRKHSKERHRSAGGSSRRSRSGSRGERHSSHRRHRKRRDGSGSRGSRASRAGTPLRDEPDALPTEPRRPPRERPPLPMLLPLPKFALQLLRNAPTTPRVPAPAPAPASPPRPPSASSSSSGSAPHSPSLEERIRSLDEKYERWSGSRVHADAPDRTRLRHRLLELDINEVKPSEVVRSLLAKRSVFDEDSERLEGAVRPPSPCSSPRSILQPILPRALRYPFPTHPPPPSDSSVVSTDTSAPSIDSDRSDPRLNRLSQSDSLPKFENDNSSDNRLRLRTPSIDKPFVEITERRDFELDGRSEKRRNSIIMHSDETKSMECDMANEKLDFEFKPHSSFFRELQENQKLQSNKPCNEALTNVPEIVIKTEKVAPMSEFNDNLVFEAKEKEQFRGEIPFWGSRRHSIKDVSNSDKVVDKLLNKSDSNVKVEKKMVETVANNNENKIDAIEMEIKKETEIYQELNLETKIIEDMAKTESRFFNHKGTVNFTDNHNRNFNQVNEYNIDTKNSENENKLLNSHVQSETHHRQELNEKELNDPFSNEEKSLEKGETANCLPSTCDKKVEHVKDIDGSLRSDRDKIKHNKERIERERSDPNKDKSKSIKHSREKHEKDRRLKDETPSKSCSEKSDKLKIERDTDKNSDNCLVRDTDKTKHFDDKHVRSEYNNHKKEKVEKERRRELIEIDPFSCKAKKEDKQKHDRQRKDNCDSKREIKKEFDVNKSRKSSRDESSKEITRKDSTDSTTSRTSHESTKVKDVVEPTDNKEDVKAKVKQENDLINKNDVKESYKVPFETNDHIDKLKVKSEIKDEKHPSDITHKNKIHSSTDPSQKCKQDGSEKQRHFSLDSSNVDNKRKERLSSCSSLPSNIGGHKRRMSSQDVLDNLEEDVKKSKNDIKCADRRDFKDSKSSDRHKTTKFNKCHFAKLFESKTKDDKKNLVKPPDDMFTPVKEPEFPDKLKSKIEEKPRKEDKACNITETRPDMHNNLDFLAIFELRSSEEDEKQRALTNEMKEKKRIQQLQQIQELQMQQGALQNTDQINKIKDDKKHRQDDKKKESVREKRMSTERKSKDADQKRKNRKQTQSTDSSDSDEPKKHSIFDIVDDGPTYISMYDKVKARSCKNMQKQEEEKRQEKIKAKFSQLKQSRAKREEKKRSSWDEDSDSEHDRQKLSKSSVDSSSDEDHRLLGQSKRHDLQRSSLTYERHSIDDYYSLANNDDDLRNKLSRKNSRSRIMSDSSEDDTRKRTNSPTRSRDFKRGYLSDNGSLRECNDINNFVKESIVEDKVKKTSLLNLFGKSDSDDNKVKSNTENDSDYKMSFIKSICNDISSENESLPPRMSSDLRKKHKKKQKKHKTTFSDEDTKTDNCDDRDNKHKNTDRKHNRKEKRKDNKSRDSVDIDDIKDEKSKRDKRPSTEIMPESYPGNTKREGKMEDIFGPLSDESDHDALSKIEQQSSVEIQQYDSFKLNHESLDDSKCKNREDNKKRKDRKRKEKKPLSKEDENSLDVDAVSKAIEARLFADSISNDDIGVKAIESSGLSKSKPKLDDLSVKFDGLNSEKYIDRAKKDFKDRKKKKKKNREDRQSRREHYYNNDKHCRDTSLFERNIDMSPKTILNIPLPNEKVETDRSDEKSLSESPSLPRLTDSPPFAIKSQEIDCKNNDTDSTIQLSLDERDTVKSFEETKSVEINDIPMPPPIENNHVQDISEVPLPEGPPKSEQTSVNNDTNMNIFLQISTDIQSNGSEDAVRSITCIDNESEKQKERESSPTDGHATKKLEEKPRAIISQEETADAVAALLGESFGGKDNTFANCFEEVVTDESNQIEIETTSTGTENIPEEDAEEMRQAVQNLNASEMEIKPDTPVSESDFLLIDTDTEETEETSQDAIEKLPLNVIATTQVQNNNVKTEIIPETSNVIVAKPKTTIVQSDIKTQVPNTANIKISEGNNTYSSIKQEPTLLATSTPTPVITSWTLSNNKIEAHTVNTTVGKDDGKSARITANILQIRPSHIANTLISNSTRLSSPYQVINRMNVNPRSQSQLTNMQPPMIKIPENHVLYQKPQGIVISPRLNAETRLQSPKSTQSEGITTSRLTNMTILTTSPQNLNSVGMSPQNAMQQRSPGQVTVVRMQQPPLSPIHIPHGARTMISPNRPNSVLVQTQGPPIHFNRLPVTPVLAPISKPLGPNIPQQHKNTCVNSSVMQQKLIPGEIGNNENVTESTKIILSPTRLQANSSNSVMANRILPMHVATMNSLHLPKKVLLNNKQAIDKRDIIQKTEHGGLPYHSSSIIHVANVNQPSTIIQSGSKSVMCSVQEGSLSRGQGQNVIHSINQQRIITGSSKNNLIQIDNNKGQPTVLSVATIRPPAVITKSDASNAAVFTTSTLTNVVMTPLLLKSTCNTNLPIRLNPRNDHVELNAAQTVNRAESNSDEKYNEKSIDGTNGVTKMTPLISKSPENVAKCETDFEELLKDNTNEIKVTNNPEKKLEVNVGKTVTVISQCNDRVDDLDEKCEVVQVSENLPTERLQEDITNIKSDEDIKDKKILESFEDCLSSEKESNNISDILNNQDKILDLEDKFKDKERDKTEVIMNSCKVFNSNNSFKDLSAFRVSPSNKENNENDIHTPEDNEFWSTKDLIIESVIKKVDSLCNDSEINPKTQEFKSITSVNDINPPHEQFLPNNLISRGSNSNLTENHTLSNSGDSNALEDYAVEKITPTSKRGGKANRGRKTEKLEKTQARQISKPGRGGGGLGRRGRGRNNKVEKKVKSLVNSNFHNMPGDIYDFHEDSGDETSSTNKAESRPRLILTIKSPLSGNAGVIPTSTLSIAQKDHIKAQEKLKEEKNEVFASPSTNTRKSRRLQEKDIQKSTSDDIVDDVKGPTPNNKNAREPNRKRPTRQAGAKQNTDKALSDTRKSPRGTKRSRDSLSDTSVDSSDENKKEETVKDAKIPKLSEPIIQPSVPEVETVVKTVPPPPMPSPPQPVVNPTPIMKPPKKMISEISAKLASAFEAAAAGPPSTAISAPTAAPVPTPATAPVASGGLDQRIVPMPVERRPVEIDRPILAHREPRPAEVVATQEPVTISLGESSDMTNVETGHIRRLVDNVPSNMMPVGATEATDARVQSPALPHRPPSTHRPADRATPILIRSGGDGIEGAGVAGVAGAAGAAGVGAGPGALAARGYRGAYPGPASLPRGAHHPPPPTTKQVAIVGPHHHHPVSRVTITNVPAVSPQGQVNMSDGMYPHFSQHHYQMYQQHFRATQQDIRASASPFPRCGGGLEAEGSEAPTPPLELRRPPSARVPRPAHSPSPADRHILYAVRCGRSPPPAHGSGRPPSALPPLAAPGPPHASQVPREADSLQMLLRRYPVMWQGLLALKNDSAAVQMHFVGGSAGVAADALSRSADGAATSLLRIAQRMRLEPAQLDQVHRKMKLENEHCMLLALPCGRDHMDVLQQSTNLSAGFITYLQRKQAAGIVNVAPSPRHQQSMYTVHIFPSCEFANENLNRIAPDLMHRVANIAHLLIVIATAIG